MPDFKTIQAFENALDRAIDSVMQGRVVDGVRDQIATSVQEDVYDVYDPKFYSRRAGNGGMKSKSKKNMEVTSYDSSTKTLTITHKVDWQQLKGGTPPSNDLTEVIQNNQVYGAPPRQYIDEAENTYAKSAFEIDLELGLREKGF